jgi:hypothetical protein
MLSETIDNLETPRDNRAPLSRQSAHVAIGKPNLFVELCPKMPFGVVYKPPALRLHLDLAA